MDYFSFIKQFGSPLYIYDAAVIRDKCRALRAAYSDFGNDIEWLYAVKANYNPHIVSLIAREGFGVDAVSLEEVELALFCGVDPKRIMYTESALTDTEMHVAYKAGVLLNIGSISRLARFVEAYPGSEVCIRVNPNVGSGSHSTNITGGPESKFGISPNDVPEARRIAAEHNVRIVGIHCHIGSGWLSIEEPLLALDVMFSFAKDFPDLCFLDAGGGFGIPYQPGEKSLDLSLLGKKTAEKNQAFTALYGKKVSLRFEPGRFLVAEAGVLVSEVSETKVLGNGKPYVGLNTSMAHLLRPAFYGSYHEVQNISRGGEMQPTDIGGNVCECADFFAKDRIFPRSEIGDIVIIKNVGAYSFSMSSEYQFRPRPAEVMVDGDNIRLIRKRETTGDLVAVYDFK